MPRMQGQRSVSRRSGLRILASVAVVLGALLVAVGLVAASERSTGARRPARTAAVVPGNAESEHRQMIPPAHPKEAHPQAGRGERRSRVVDNGAASREDAVPVLMYHAIAAAPNGAPYPDLYLSRKSFAKQMLYLAEHGFHVVTLQRV
jgi:hypothetical protein